MIELFYLGLAAGLCLVVAPFVALALRAGAGERSEKSAGRVLLAYLEIATLTGAVFFSAALVGPYRYALGEVFGLDLVYGPIPVITEPEPTRRCSPTSIACLPAREQERIIAERRDRSHRSDLVRGGTFAGVALIFGFAHVGLRRIFVREPDGTVVGRVHLGTGLVVFGLLASMFLVSGVGELTDQQFLADPRAVHMIGSALPFGLGALTVWLLYVVVLVVELVRAYPEAVRRVLARLRPTSF